ncbi:cell division protein ZapA [Bacteroidales bacterium OttesenSCG-928-C19]|nr:cell division protein ZapA [Bacteroidales bacterium OttesenSCG-928-C19]
MNDLSISVNILDRNYKLKVTTETEEYVREAAKLIEDNAKKYSSMFAHKDRQDLLAMIALEKITSLLQIEKRVRYQGTELLDKLKEIDSVLTEQIEQ